MGHNPDGQLGLGDKKNRIVPTKIPGIKWKTIGAADWANCGLALNGTGYCWGYNADGRAGTGNFKTPLLTPQKVKAAWSWKFLTPGYFYACGIRGGDSLDGALYCWGKNNHGRLGNGKFTGNENLPVRVGNKTDWVSVYPGGDHTCAMRKDNSVWCFGNNEDGQLGVGKTRKELPYSTTPVKVVGGPWKSFSSNSKFTCLINMKDEGMCFGSNEWGQLGVGTKGDYYTKPTKIKASGTWKQLSCGQFATCGIKGDSTAWCWGTGFTKPLQFKAGNNKFITVVAGDWSAGGVTSDGKAYALWENEWGEGGVNSTKYLEKFTPMVGGGKWGPPQ